MEAEKGRRRALLMSELLSDGGGTRELRRRIPTAWPHDPGNNLRGNDAGVRGFIAGVAWQRIQALNERNQREEITVGFQTR